MKIILMVGPPGSGKSTYAKNIEAKMDYVYINQDTQGQEHLKKFHNAIEHKLNIVVDRLNFTKEQRAKYLKPADDAGYTTEIVLLHESSQTCLERCLARVGHETIQDEHSAGRAIGMFFSKYERVEDHEADMILRIWPEGYKRDAIWCDIDNTLSDSNWRNFYLERKPKDWKGFFEAMNLDNLNVWCAELLDGMRLTNKAVVICSGRPADYRDITQTWLEEHNIQHDDLFMRRRGDFRRDDIVKEMIYEFEVKTRYNLLFAVDDRKQVIDKLRSHGILVLDCAGPKGDW